MLYFVVSLFDCLVWLCVQMGMFVGWWFQCDMNLKIFLDIDLVVDLFGVCVVDEENFLQGMVYYVVEVFVVGVGYEFFVFDFVGYEVVDLVLVFFVMLQGLW